MASRWAGYLLCAALLTTLSGAPASSQTPPPSPSGDAPAGPAFRAGSIAVSSPWTRATPNGAKIAGGYMVIANSGTQPDRLVSLSTEAAGRSELHEMSMANGVMTMRPIEGIEIAPGASVEFKPAGYHVMFMDLKQSLKAGDAVRAVLRFEKAGPVEVLFAVGSIGASRAPQAHAH